MIELSPKVIAETREYIEATCGFEKLAILADLNVEVLRNTLANTQKPTRIAPLMISHISEGFYSLGLTPPQIQSAQLHRSARTMSLIDSYRHLLN
jgi:hypothetical protein